MRRFARERLRALLLAAVSRFASLRGGRSSRGSSAHARGNLVPAEGQQGRAALQRCAPPRASSLVLKSKSEEGAPRG